ncbi:facilitated trehalose transporter Tret1 isoform X2 [Galleria mellonella]|uniref:Facilitated trehalose transporter Tret1-B n=1 Tax=Galleria mellonella TaxID=7137 RepID=A0A3G1T1H2_GALME|nr:facilitated trehalose transporter Tret1 isoform X2 [Galleria mellonella]AXY94829.1 facilitated trehalose transporter Tret1-B [Galleria mellonella]
MEILKSPLQCQIFVVTGVLSTIVSCGLGLGYLSIFLEQNGADNINSFRSNSKLLGYIETAGEIAFLPSIVIIPIVMQKKGRRLASIVTTIPLLISWLISFNAKNFISVLCVNILNNISLGGAVTISSIIISEFCDPKYRGIFLMLETGMISLGVLLSHIFGIFLHWTLVSSLGVITALISLITTYFWPESPYWLISQGHILKGTEVFQTLRGTAEESMEELEILLITQKRKLQLNALKPMKVINLREKVTNYLKSLLKADFLKPLSIMILLFSFIGFGGENIMSNYKLTDVFNLTNGKYIGTIILDVLTLVCSLTACVLIQIVKRKTLFLFTSSFSIIFLGFTSILLFLQSFEIFSKDYLWIVLSLVTGFVMFMSLGTTALPFSLLGEIFPMSYKGVGSSLTCAYLWAFGNTIIKSAPFVTNSIGVHGMMLLSILMMILILILINKIMPETNAKTLLEIQQLMKLTKDGDYEVTSLTHELEESENFDRLQLFIEV